MGNLTLESKIPSAVRELYARLDLERLQREQEALERRRAKEQESQAEQAQWVADHLHLLPEEFQPYASFGWEQKSIYSDMGQTSEYRVIQIDAPGLPEMAVRLQLSLRYGGGDWTIPQGMSEVYGVADYVLDEDISEDVYPEWRWYSNLYAALDAAVNRSLTRAEAEVQLRAAQEKKRAELAAAQPYDPTVEDMREMVALGNIDQAVAYALILIAEYQGMEPVG